MTHTTSQPETFTESITLTLTPSLRRRLKDFADQRDWYETDAARYFIQDGLEGDDRRTTLSEEIAASVWSPKPAPKRLRWAE